MFLAYRFPSRNIGACHKCLSMQAFSHHTRLPIYRSAHYACSKSLLRQYLAECDEVVLMKDGQVAEHGIHAQLMARGRDYATLFTSVQQEVQFITTLRETSRVTRLRSSSRRLLHNSWSVACKAVGLEMTIQSLRLYFMSALICERSTCRTRPWRDLS